MVANRLDLELQALHVVSAEGEEFVMWLLPNLVFQRGEGRLGLCVLLALGLAADVAEKIV